ncbi:hypothetical protein O181_092785 [Austropuccinia psidii MF-1]|uniref:Uncharacterized protein n=1 Tax=Austropuccinia psidii MF-1 TaxID=1389203 RepID=A0A9Q3P9H3_9BASI|nr:hypothetical protein [Austropuccinia psidii MF-1]
MDYVSSCQQCSRNKNIHHQKFGLLKPLQIPSGPWNSLSMDFITQLPLSKSFDSILVAVDRFSKMEIFIPTYEKITALESAQIFICHVFPRMEFQSVLLVIEDLHLFDHFGLNCVSSSRYQEVFQLLSTLKQMDRQSG